MPRSGPVPPLRRPLTDGVVTVRQRRAADVAAIAAASHDPQTLRWLVDPAMDAEASRTSMSRVEEAWRSGRAAPLTISDAGTDEAVGIINVQFSDDTQASVAYSVFPAHRGQGIAPRAVRLVTGWALRDLGVAQVLLEADEENAASLRVAEKCRFQRVGSRSEKPAEGPGRTVVIFARPAT
jgi:RimJ/RimL family protein N-acetyltransferase